MKQLWVAVCTLGVLSFGYSKDSGASATGGTNPVICDDSDLGLRVLWGDTHVHTRLSLDSFWFNSLAGPREAYQFAKGGTVGIAGTNRFDVIRERAWTSPIWHETPLNL